LRFAIRDALAAEGDVLARSGRQQMSGLWPHVK
jgi:hypothetical protein